MIAPLILVTGTGTGIGKTHVSGALLLAWARVLADRGVAEPKVAGIKPVESGVQAGHAADADALEQLSTFHVKRFPPPYLLALAVSPHLAARAEGRGIELAVISRYVDDVRAAGADGVVVELAGGLFSPLAPGVTNADVASDLDADAVILVAPDRLGVLHDVAATTRAAASANVTVTGVVLVAPAAADASTSTNAGELALVTALPLLAVLPRADVHTLARRPDLLAIVRAVRSC